MTEEGNRYVEELKKCIKQHVKVVGVDGEVFEGTCIAINFQHLNVVLMTDTEKIIVKNVRNISRKRKSDESA